MGVDTRLARLIDERDAIRLIVDFYTCLDSSDASGCAQCFSQEGVWDRDMGTVTGRASIEQAVTQREPSRRTAHTVLNFQYEAKGEDRAELRFTLVAYDGIAREPSLPPIGRVAGIRHCIDQLERLDGTWRIGSRTSTALLRGQ